MKVYLHCNGTFAHRKEFTLVITVDRDNDSIEFVLERFINDCKAKGLLSYRIASDQDALDALKGRLVIKDTRRNPVRDMSKKIAAVLTGDDEQDLFVEEEANDDADIAKSSSQEANSPNDIAESGASDRPSASNVEPDDADEEINVGEDQQVTQEQGTNNKNNKKKKKKRRKHKGGIGRYVETEKELEPARLAFKESRYRDARIMCETFLEMKPTSGEAKSIIFKILMLRKRYEEALELVNGMGSKLLDSHEIIELCGDLGMEVHDYQRARTCYERLVKWLEHNDEIITVLNQPIHLRTVSRRNQVRGKLAKALVKMGEEEVGLRLLQDVVHNEEDGNSNIPALIFYASILDMKGYYGEALKLLLQALTAEPENKGLRQKICQQMLEKPAATKRVLDEMFPSLNGRSVVAGLAFIANAARDYGCIDVSKDLYGKAWISSPTHGEVTLCFVHVLELDLEYMKAIKVLGKFLEITGQGSTSEQLSPRMKLACEMGSRMSSLALRILSEQSLTLEDEEEAGKLLSPYAFHASWDTAKETIEITRLSDQNSNDVARAEEEAISQLPLDQDDTSLKEDDPGVLGAIFALVKILYIADHRLLRLIPLLVKIMEPFRRNRELHRTELRNENAYYTCIMHLLPHHLERIGENFHYRPPENKLYICGDSHSLPCAWQVLNVDGVPHELVPKHVTGLKGWHLRKGNMFFPKYQFTKATKNIPDAAKVLFLFCEIDCREGVVTAFHQDKYDSVEKAIEKVVQIYTQQLYELARFRQFKVYVHPVPPVLDITRPVVRVFNEILLRHMQTSMLYNAAGSKQLHYLDFFSRLVVPVDNDEGDENETVTWKLNPSYEFDGTHLNPSYLPLVEEAISKTSGQAFD